MTTTPQLPAAPAAPNPHAAKGTSIASVISRMPPERRAALARIAKAGGKVGLATYAASLIAPKVTQPFAGEGDADWACKPPAEGRTKFYPVTGNGHYDDVAQVDQLDKATADLNDELFGYDTERVRSFHDARCPHGCVQTVTKPATMTPTLADQYLNDVNSAIVHAITALNVHNDEPWVQVLIQQRYGAGTDFDLADLREKLEAVSTAAGKMLTTSNDAATTAHSLLRDTVKHTRAQLAKGYSQGEPGFSWVATAAGAVAGLPGGLLGAGVGAASAGLASSIWNDRFPADIAAALDSDLDAAASAAKSALRENDDAVAEFNRAVSAFAGEDMNFPERIIPAVKGWLSSVGDKVKEVGSKLADTLDDLLPDDTSTPTLTDPGTPDTPTLSATAQHTDTPLGMPTEQATPRSASTSDPLKGLWDSTANAVPNLTSPLGSTQMPDLGSAFAETPTAATPLASTSADDVPMSDAAFDQLMGADDTAPLDEELEPAEDTDRDTDSAEEPVEGTVDEPAVPENSDDRQARTVELPDGRQVTFPTEQHAALVRDMLDGTTLRDAAMSAGFQPDGGEPVPATDVQVGDVVRGADGCGVVIGDGEVLMENGEIRPLEDVSKVESADHGVFRLEPADAPAPAAAGEPGVPPAPAADPVPVMGDQPEVPRIVPPTPTEGVALGVPTAPAPAPAPSVVPVMGGEQPAPAPVSGDPLQLLFVS